MELQTSYPLTWLLSKFVRPPHFSTFPPFLSQDLTYRSPEEVVGLLKNELKLTMAYLQIHPKVYWIWNHRKWCLEHVPLGPATETESPSETLLVQGGRKTEDGMGETTTSEGWRCGFWKGELAVVEALLNSDARNCQSSFPRCHPANADIIRSPRMGLQTLCPSITTQIFPTSEDITARARIHTQEDRKQFQQFLSMAL